MNKTNVVHRHMLNMQRLERSALIRVKRCYTHQKGFIIAYLHTQPPAGWVLGLPIFFEFRIKPLWENTLKQIWQDSIEEAEKEIRDIHSGIIKKDWQDYADQWLKDNVGTKIDGITNTDQEWLANTLQSGLNEGKSNDEIASDLTDDWDNMSDGRAGTIARTEMAGSYNYATQQTAGDLLPDDSTKIWNVTSSNPRPWHEEADGQEVGIDEPFDVDGEDMMFPGDPSGSPENVINCMCVVSYNINTPEENELSPEEEESALSEASMQLGGEE
jgi:hypothetical protein